MTKENQEPGITGAIAEIQRRNKSPLTPTGLLTADLKDIREHLIMVEDARGCSTYDAILINFCHRIAQLDETVARLEAVDKEQNKLIDRVGSLIGGVK